MQLFSNLKTGTKLYAIVALMSAVMILVGGIGLFLAKSANKGLETVYKDRVICLQQLKTISDMYAVNIVDTTHKLRDGSVNWSEGRRNLDDARKKIGEEWKAYSSTYLVPEEKKLVDEAIPLMKTADDAIDKLSGMIDKKDSADLTRFAATGLYPGIDPITDKISKLSELQLRVAKEEFEKSDSAYSKGMAGLIGLIIIASLISAALATLVIRALLKELGGEPHYVKEIARTVANGDLSVSVNVDPRDSGSILHAMGNMVESLRDLVS
jgi:methyl-accepting chemotaxis protein